MSDIFNVGSNFSNGDAVVVTDTTPMTPEELDAALHSLMMLSENGPLADGWVRMTAKERKQAALLSRAAERETQKQREGPRAPRTPTSRTTAPLPGFYSVPSWQSLQSWGDEEEELDDDEETTWDMYKARNEKGRTIEDVFRSVSNDPTATSGGEEKETETDDQSTEQNEIEDLAPCLSEDLFPALAPSSRTTSQDWSANTPKFYHSSSMTSSSSDDQQQEKPPPSTPTTVWGVTCNWATHSSFVPKPPTASPSNAQETTEERKADVTDETADTNETHPQPQTETQTGEGEKVEGENVEGESVPTAPKVVAVVAKEKIVIGGDNQGAPGSRKNRKKKNVGLMVAANQQPPGSRKARRNKDKQNTTNPPSPTPNPSPNPNPKPTVGTPSKPTSTASPSDNSTTHAPSTTGGDPSNPVERSVDTPLPTSVNTQMANATDDAPPEAAPQEDPQHSEPETAAEAIPQKTGCKVQFATDLEVPANQTEQTSAPSPSTHNCENAASTPATAHQLAEHKADELQSEKVDTQQNEPELVAEKGENNKEQVAVSTAVEDDVSPQACTQKEEVPSLSSAITPERKLGGSEANDELDGCCIVKSLDSASKVPASKEVDI
eukprot:TRINITY_DN5001_c0_g1_i1.p1 TRINITY_DN5001_c0_g1~~TRINITY_DN5001_c0_g1_i1.p1  ORF type:complete len:667 (+),score=92.33 TRINITY_DN5001_c0_g1_i1:178-2001(+)